MGEEKLRTVPMQVLALGISRSGTESIRKTLEDLGYLRTYHGVRDLMTGNDGDVWGDLTERKYGDHPQPITREHLDTILWDCAAVTDFPSAAFWSELMDAYPDAKVLLVERDIDAWYTSFHKVVIDELFSWERKAALLAMQFRMLPNDHNMFINRLYLKYFRAEDEYDIGRNAKAVYREHYDGIEARAKAERRPVLRMRIEDGWQPICDFLGKERPEWCEAGGLPRSNTWETTVALSRGYHRKLMRDLAWRLAEILGVAVVGLVATVWAVVWLRGGN